LKGDYQWRLRRKTAATGANRLRDKFSLVRLVEEIPRKAGLFRVFQEKCSRISLQLRLRGGGSRIRTPDTLLGFALRSRVLATYRDLRLEMSILEKRIRLGEGIE